MALPPSTSLVRTFNIVELKEAFDTGGVFAGESATINIAAQKAAFVAVFDDRIQFLKDNPPADETAWIAAMTALQSFLPTDLDAEISSTQTYDLADAMQAAYEVFDAEDQVEHAYPCPQCGTNGKIPIYNANGTDSGNKRACPLSDGWGYTSTEYAIDPNSKQYIPV